MSELETVYHAEGASTAELEALLIKGLLEGAGIPAVIVGNPILPNMPFDVKVPSEDVELAKQLIEEHQRDWAHANN